MSKELYNEIRIALNISSYARIDIDIIEHNIISVKTFLAQGPVSIIYSWNSKIKFEENISNIEHMLSGKEK